MWLRTLVRKSPRGYLLHTNWDDPPSTLPRTNIGVGRYVWIVFGCFQGVFLGM